MISDFWALFVKEYRHLRTAVIVLLLTITTSLLEGVNISLLIPLLESLNPNSQGSIHWISEVIEGIFDVAGIPFQISTILGVLGVFMLGIATLKYLTVIYVARSALSFRDWLRSTYMWNLLNADMTIFDRTQMGIQTDTLTLQTDRASGSLTQLNMMASHLGLMAAYLTAALIIAPVLTGVAIGFMILVTTAVQYNIIRTRRMSASRVKTENDFQASAIEALNGIQVVKSFGLEPIRWAEFNQKTVAVGDVGYALSKIIAQLTIFQEVALFMLVGGITYVGVAVLGLDLTVVVALLFTFYRLAPRVSGFNQMRQNLVVSMTSFRSVTQALEESSSTNIPNGDKPFTGLQDSVQFNNLKFSYGTGVTALKKVDFTIKKGELTAIVGPSGAGKSTLIDLILRYYDPSDGAILVDGINLTEFDLKDWRRSIGLVSQDVFLFNDTVSNNISLGRPGVSEADIVEAASQAYANDFISELPHGYQTNVGDRGWNLSGGQCQRLALARAILLKPGILILDEATSSLDSESEQLIQQHIQSIRGTCTIIVVAHRMSTIRSADNIVVLQDGIVIEQGDSESLVAKAGMYANFQRLQSEG